MFCSLRAVKVLCFRNGIDVPAVTPMGSRSSSSIKIALTSISSVAINLLYPYLKVYKYDNMKSRFSVSSDLVSGCFNVDTGRFTLRESEVNALNRTWPDLGFLTNQRAWTGREPAVNQLEAIKGPGIIDLIHDRVHAVNWRASENPWTEILKTSTPTLVGDHGSPKGTTWWIYI